MGLVDIHASTETETFRALDELQQEHGMVINRIDIAFDFIPTNPNDVPALRKLIEQGTYLLHRTKGWMEKEGSERNLVSYSDLPSKIDGKPCVHLELRNSTARAVKRMGINRVRDIPTINPRKLFNQWIRMVQFDPQKFKSRMIKITVQEERRSYLNRTRVQEECRSYLKRTGHDITTSRYDQWYDERRNDLARRTDNLLKHIYQDCVQLVRDRHEEYVDKLMPLHVNIPSSLTSNIQISAQLKSLHNS